MAQKKPKIDVSAARSPLTDSPFGNLSSLRGDLPIDPTPKPAPKAEILDDTKPTFRVAKTKKGGWPVSFEKRAAGKLATLIQHVSGDGESLLKALRKHCATGGALKLGTIELQGDHRDKVAAWLDKHLG